VEGDPRTRPEPGVLVVPGTEELLHDVAMRHLGRADGWYRRAGRIVQAGQDDHGKPKIIPVSAARFTSRLSSIVRWQKINAEGDEVEIGCPPIVAASAFSAGDWPELPPLVGVQDIPIFRTDGSIVQTPGYDTSTRMIYAPSVKLAPIPERISQSMANESLVRILDLLCDVHFEREEMRYLVLSAIMSLAARSITGPVPAHLYTAAQPGTGKGLLSSVISEIALGRPPVPFHFPLVAADERRGSDREEEQEKRLAQAAMSGTRMLFLDNLPNGSHFGGPIFDRVVQAEDTVALRQLGRNDEMLEFPWRAIFIVNGNHIHVLNDSRRRCEEARIISPCANPSQRKLSSFKYPDLKLGYCLKNRAELLWHVYIIIAHHAQNGFARTHDRNDMANFERYQSVVCDAIVRAGGLDPSLCVLTVEDTLSGDDQLVGCAMRVLEKLGAYHGAANAEGVTATQFAERVWTAAWLETLSGKGAPENEDMAILEAREVFMSNWRINPNKRPGAKAISGRLGDLCGRVLSGSQVWPADDQSGFQTKEWRITQHLDRKNQPRFTIVPPRG
jgi:hypothetical protein